MVSRGRSLPFVTGLLVLLGVAGAPAAQATGGPVTYTGTVASATGSAAGQRGHAVSVVLTGYHAPTPSGGLPLGSFTAVIRCSVRRHCVSGTVRGTWTTMVGVPDTGNGVALQGRGRLRRLHGVTARGTAHGPGNIGAGRPQLVLRIHGRRGSERIVAQAPTVAGFTPVF